MPPFLLSSLIQDGYTYCLIEDSIAHSGRPLLHALVCNFSDRFDQVHVFSTESDPNDVRNGTFNTEVTHKLTVHDYWTDPVGWRGTSNGESSLRLDSTDNTLLSVVQSSIGATPCRVAVVIDTISSFLPHRTDHQIATELSSLISAAEDISEIQSIAVFGLLHSSLHSTKTLKAVRYQARIQVNLLLESARSSSLRDAQGVYEVTVQKKNGKVKRQKEVYHISDSHVISTALHEQHHEIYEESQPDPTANLTFNLTLKDSEKLAKENVVLPYTSKQEQPKPDHGQIFYEPDDADDFDEEDPDDDLDI